MPFTRSNADTGHSPSVAQDRRLRHPCRRFSKLDAAFELRHSKELASSCIIMQSMSVHPAVRFDISDFPSRLRGQGGRSCYTRSLSPPADSYLNHWNSLYISCLRCVTVY